MRTPIQGEALLDSLSRDAFATLLEETSTEFDERGARRVLEGVLNSGRPRAACSSSTAPSTPTSSSPTQGRLAALGVPTLILWGQQDEYLPLDYASRFAEQIPGSKLVLLEGVRHFLFEDEPERCAQEVDRLPSAGGYLHIA